MTKYIDLHEIGSGGFANVYACRCDANDEIYAKKKLAADAGSDAVKRFAKEVRILSTLDHPHVVKIISKKLQTPPYFYIMPLYKRSLRAELPSLIGDSSRIDSIFARILNAIEYAHSEGILHRDLKPENVLLNDDTDIVVTDFGLGRILDSDSTRQTMTGDYMGTPWYMAPEQMLDAKRADERSDIFSLGRMLYELYTGPITSSVQDTSSLPPSIAMIVKRCTQHNPEKRFQRVLDLRTVWQNLHDKANLKTELEKLLNLRTKLATAASISKNDVKSFCDLIIKYIGDHDLIHDTVMQISPQAAFEIYATNPDLLKLIISEFVNFICSQGWPFGYTDEIGRKCRDFYKTINDPNIRANLIYCVSEVGISHNRFFVMDIMESLFYADKNSSEWAAIERRFIEGLEDLRCKVGKHIKMSKLPTSLVAIFNFDE